MNITKSSRNKSYFYALILLIICSGTIGGDGTARLTYADSLVKDPGWKQLLEKFVHKYRHYCTNADMPGDVGKASGLNSRQAFDDVPYFSPCNLSQRDFLNLYKIAKFEDDTGSPLPDIVIGGCKELPNEEAHKIELMKSEGFICRDRIKNRCVMKLGDRQLEDRLLVLPGTKLKYKCQDGFFPPNWATDDKNGLIAECVENKWSPDIPTCRAFQNPANKPNNDWGNPTIWSHSVFPDECGDSSLIDPETLKDLNSSVGPTVHYGENATLGDFPWQAVIYDIPKRHKPICGASIISRRFLLTAAHCFTFQDQSNGVMRNASDFEIAVGTVISNYTEIREIDEDKLYLISKILNPAYGGRNVRHQNDLAVMITTKEIEFNNVVGPVCLINDFQPYINETEKLYTAGWGVTENKKTSNILQSVTLFYISYEACLSQVNHSSEIMTPEKFCVGRKNSHAPFDNGDSGGGLVVRGPEGKFFLLGIISLKSINNATGVATHLPFFHYWLYTHLRANEYEYLIQRKIMSITDE